MATILQDSAAASRCENRAAKRRKKNYRAVTPDLWPGLPRDVLLMSEMSEGLQKHPKDTLGYIQAKHPEIMCENAVHRLSHAEVGGSSIVQNIWAKAF